MDTKTKDLIDSLDLLKKQEMKLNFKIRTK